MRKAALFGLLAAASMAANAEVVTFDGVPYDPDFPVLMDVYVENGVTVTSLGGTFWAYPTPGQLHLDPDDFLGNTVYDFTFEGGLFDLLGLDVSFASPGATGHLFAFSQDGSLLSSLTFDASSTGSLSFDSFNGVHLVRLVDTDAHFSIDNFNFRQAIPEPGTWAMMLIGFGAAGYALRRRRAAAVPASV